MVDSADLARLRIPRDQGTDASGHRSRRTLYIGLGVLALALVATAAALGLRDRPLEVRVATAVVRGGSASGVGGLTANGYVVARTKASVSSKVAGRLVYLGVEEGDLVREGQVLARLEDAEYVAAVRQAAAERLSAEAARQEAQAAVAQAERDLERARALAAEGHISPQQLEDAETALAVARARLAAAEARVAAAEHVQAAAEAALENTRVRAPFTGTVLRKDAEVGEVVAPSVAGTGLTRGAVVTMADLSTLEVEVDVNEAYIGGVQRGQPAEIVLDAYPTLRFPGRVRQIMPTADRQKATVLVRVAIETQDSRILPEMGARVVFLEPTGAETLADATGAEGATAGETGDPTRATPGASRTPTPRRVFAPAAAVRNEGGENVVYVVVGDVVRRRVVDAGPVSGGEREIRQGLNGGERLVVDAPAGLADGARVRIAGTN